MTTSRPEVDEILRIPVPSYHAILNYAKSTGRGGSSDDRTWSIRLLRGLMDRYPHVLAIGQELVLTLLEEKDDKEAASVLELLDREFANLDEETQCRWGRIFKDQADAYMRLPWSDPDGRPPDPELARVFYAKALARYDKAYLVRSGYYPGINKATLLLILGTLQPPIADAPAKELAESEALAKTLLDARPRWPVGSREDETLWQPATAGEAYLLRRLWDAASQQYRVALQSPFLNPFARKSMYRQAERISMCFANLGVAIAPPLDDPRAFFGVDGAGTAPTNSGGSAMAP